MPTITNKGQEYALFGDSVASGQTGGGIVRKAVQVALYTTGGSGPQKDGTGFLEASGGGYARNSISPANWTLALDTGNYKVTLADQVWTAAGGSIANIMGAYILDAGGLPLAWFERTSSISIISGDQLTITGIVLRAS